MSFCIKCIKKKRMFVERFLSAFVLYFFLVQSAVLSASLKYHVQKFYESVKMLFLIDDDDLRMCKVLDLQTYCRVN